VVKWEIVHKAFGRLVQISLGEIQGSIQIQSWKVLVPMLETVYPAHRWDMDKLSTFGRAIKASQREVFLAVQSLFPNNGITLSQQFGIQCRG